MFKSIRRFFCFLALVLGRILCKLGLHSWEDLGLAQYGRGRYVKCRRCPASERRALEIEEIQNRYAEEARARGSRPSPSPLHVDEETERLIDEKIRQLEEIAPTAPDQATYEDPSLTVSESRVEPDEVIVIGRDQPEGPIVFELWDDDTDVLPRFGPAAVDEV